jgi:hypothetical protein
MGDILADSHTIHAPKLIKLEPQDADISGMNLKCLVCDEDDAGRHYGSICCRYSTKIRKNCSKKHI